MTRKEWVEKNLPAYVSNKAHGGVLCFPSWGPRKEVSRNRFHDLLG